MANINYKASGRKRYPVPVESEILVYGTVWCGMTQIVRRYLDRAGLPYRYIDIEDDKNAENQLRWITGGFTNHPTVVIDGQVLIEPEIEELHASLEENGYL